MARIEVCSVSMSDDKIETMEVKLVRLGDRVIDRDTAVRWMKDGHSFIPQKDGDDGPALRLVEVEGEYYIRRNLDEIASDDVGL